MTKWDDMNFWKSGEWQALQERLTSMIKAGQVVCPERKDWFAALDATPYEKCNVMIMGQDPYPDPEFATGIAFSIPDNAKRFPATLENIFKEYVRDLHLPRPNNGALTHWTKQGVLLWNAIPTCNAHAPNSHYHWPEWFYLTEEIILKLNEKDSMVFCFLGSVAREYSKFVDTNKHTLIETSHPSPRGSLNAKHPFVGSRIFSKINDELVQEGLEPIDWRL